MFNRFECGLHHPGNVVPCCISCNKRPKNEKRYISWEEHLLDISQDIGIYKERRGRIIQHKKSENYPELTHDELNTLKAITNHLYISTQVELDKSFDLFVNIDKTIINKKD
jgi:hypothetical protein